jgi:hypothetical protein
MRMGDYADTYLQEYHCCGSATCGQQQLQAPHQDLRQVKQQKSDVGEQLVSEGEL